MLLNTGETTEPLTEEEQERRIINLECGYSAVAENEIQCSGIRTGFIYTLKKDEKEILSICIGQSERELQERAKLWETISGYIAETEGEEKAGWIRRNLLKLPADIPPWERREATRQIKDVNYQDVRVSLNDIGNAERFEKECKEYLVFDKSSGEWFAWVINHWEKAGEKLGAAARFVATSILEEVKIWEKKRDNEARSKQENSEDKQWLRELTTLARDLLKHLNYSKGDRAMRAMHNVCSGSSMVVDLKELSDVNLIACNNGILDTKEGVFYENWEADRFKDRFPTHFIPRTYTKGARPKTFLYNLLYTAFYDNTTSGLSDDERRTRSAELCRYFSRCMGYILVAGNPEQIMIFLWGEGANGKSTTTDIIRFVLGNEIQEAPGSELYRNANNGHSTGIARALSCRGLIFTELTEDEHDRAGAAKIDTDTIKVLTGETQTNRFREIYKASVAQDILCVVFASTNNVPKFNNGLDAALLRRLILLPFLHVFTDADRDKDIMSKLRTEVDEIFSYIVDELIAYRHGNPKADNPRYQKPGLPEPPEFCQAIREELLADIRYLAFIAECCTKTDGETKEARTYKKIVELQFIAWADKNGIDYAHKPLTGCNPEKELTQSEQKAMANAFRVKGIKDGKDNGTRYYRCILNL